MTLYIDNLIRQKLVLVRQLYQHAESQSFKRYNLVSRTMAVIGFDLVAESLIKTVVSAIDTKEQPEKTFDALIQQVNDKLSKGGHGLLPDEGSIRRVHEIRNFVQHKAVYPDEAQVSECRTYIRDFARKTTAQFWDMPFDGISLIDFVRDLELKTYLTKAQSDFEQQRFIEAINEANSALALAIYKARKKLFPPSSPRSRNSSINYGFKPPDSPFLPRGVHEETWKALMTRVDGLSKEIDKVQKRVDKVQEEIQQELADAEEVALYNVLDLNYADFLRLRVIAGLARVVYYIDGGRHIHISRMKENPNSEDATFVINYCIESVIQVELRIGDLVE